MTTFMRERLLFFLSENQVFLNGMELKADLKKLDEHYSRLPDGVKETGIMKFAQYPPLDEEYLLSARQ